jgi:hypothetical protein
VSGRLDDEKLETLRSWGAGLAADGRDELRAAGKAILILVQEIERLQVDIWHRDKSPRDARTAPAEPSLEEAAEAFLTDNDPPAGLELTLRGRVGRFLGVRAPNRH